MDIKNRVLIILFLLLYSCILLADTSSRYLSEAVKEYREQLPDTLIGEISVANQWLDDAELRLKTDDSDDRNTSYQLRLNPKGFGQAKAEQKILNYHEENRQIDYKIGLNDYLKQLYINIIDLIELKTHLNYLKLHLTLTDSEVQYYRSQVVSESFQPEKLQSIILQRSYLQKQIKKETSYLSERTKTLEINPDDLLLKQYILPSQILESRTQFALDESNYFALEKSRVKLKISQEKRNRLRSRSGISFSLLQLEHETSDQESNTSIGLGLRIPLGKESFNSLQQQYSISDVQSEIYDKSLAVQNKLEDKKRKIRSLAMDSKLINVSLAEINTRLGSNENSKIAELTLLLKQKQVSTSKQQMDIHIMSLRNYIEYLHVAGFLVQQPIQNWLKPDFPQL